MGVNNRIHIQLIYIILGFVFFLTIPTAHANSYQDYSDQHSYPNETLEQLVEVYAYDAYDVDEAQRMIDRIGAIPEIILKKTLTEGVRLILVDFPITDLAEYAHLRGEQPRGHDEGAVWDDIPGGGGEITVARIGYSAPGESHGSLNLELHEFAHAIEYALYDSNIAYVDEFIHIHQKEKDELFPGDYYMDYPDEYFAETLAYFYLDEEHGNILQESAPETYAFIDNLATSILLIEDSTDEGITLVWEAGADAAFFEVFRDGVLIDTTSEPLYVDTQFSEYASHEYSVKSYYIDGTVLSESLPIYQFTEANEVLEVTGSPHIQVKEVGSSYVYLSWDPVRNASYYEIYRDDLLVETTHIEQYDDLDLDDSMTYTYQVKAYNVNDTVIELQEEIVQTEEKKDEKKSFILLVVIGIAFVLFIMTIVIVITLILMYKKKEQLKHERP